MKKEEILNELRKTANKYPPSYNSLCTVAKVILYVAIVLFILGVIGSIVTWTKIGFISFVTTMVSTCASAGVLYAISAGLNGLAAIVLNTAQSRDLILFKLKQENDLFDK